MKRLRHVVLGMCAGLAALGIVQPVLGQQTGTLVFNMKSYTSGVKLSAKVQKQLKNGGLDWGMVGHTLVVPLVNERYLKLDGQYFTRFGEQKNLELAPGDYTITCIAYELTSVTRDVDTALSRNAYFNPDVLKFTIAPGKTTTLEVSSNYMRQSAWNEKIFLPDLTVRVLEDGTQTGEAVINRWADRSVAWDNYHGPLKF